MADEWVVLDFETASTRGTPCQLAAVRCREGTEIDALQSYIFQPSDAFDPFNMALHGITPQVVADAPPWSEVVEILIQFAGGAPLVAHNAPFDLGVIRDACDTCGLPWPGLRYACTLSISRQVWPGLSSYSLLLLCAALEITGIQGHHHEALYDARLAAAVLRRALVAREAPTLSDLLERLHVRYGELTVDGWYGSHLRPLSAGDIAVNEDADRASPFYGKRIVFTGALAMVRRDAWRLTASAGGTPEESVTKKTDYLVCGLQDVWKLAAGETKSQKLRKAEQLHAGGQPIEILTERDFFRMLESIEAA
jgi:DNA polymerase III epsilon subunit-like protein